MDTAKDTATSDHLAWLQDKLSGYESKLSEAEATVAKFRPLVSHLRDVIDALTAEQRGPNPLGSATISPGPLEDRSSRATRIRICPIADLSLQTVP